MRAFGTNLLSINETLKLTLAVVKARRETFLSNNLLSVNVSPLMNRYVRRRTENQ